MPARKKRPDKHGLRDQGPVPVPSTDPLSGPELILISKFVDWERREPRGLHYVGWPDVATAHKLAKRGLITEGPATECYYVTDLFRRIHGMRSA